MSIEKKLQDILKGDKKSLKRQQALEQDSDMARMLELSDHEFTITMINILSTVMDKEPVRTDWQC